MIRDCATCPELVLINAGRFAMGAGSEGLEQQVSLTTTQEVQIAAPFAIGRYEITFDEWSQCVGDGGCTSQPADENWGRGRRPVINVSFNDITQQYLPWLSRKTGFTYRLPTEAEWEFAARGGAAAPAGQAYSFGDDGSLLCQYGNSSDLAGQAAACSDGFANTAPAGSLKPNALGLFDMHGNVWEWMADCWQPQYSAKAAKPAEACTTRVLRGGSWASNAAALRSAARGWESQDKSKNSIGFRVAQSAAVNNKVCKGEYTVKKRFFISFSLYRISLVLFALVLSVASATPAGAQGMISAPSEEDDLAEVELGDLGKMSAQEISTVQRLLLRLGYLKDDNMTRAMDRPTIAAVVAHLKAVNTSPKGLTAEMMLRSLFTAAWTKEGWGSGTADGQDLVVDKG